MWPIAWRNQWEDTHCVLCLYVLHSQPIVIGISLVLFTELREDAWGRLTLNEGLSRYVRDDISLVLILLLAAIWYISWCICVWFYTFTFRKFLFDGISLPVVIARSVMSFWAIGDLLCLYCLEFSKNVQTTLPGLQCYFCCWGFFFLSLYFLKGEVQSCVCVTGCGGGGTLSLCKVSVHEEGELL